MISLFALEHNLCKMVRVWAKLEKKENRMLQNRSANWEYNPTTKDSVQACADLEQTALEWGYPKSLALNLNLIVEELFLNTINHGVTETCQPDIQISLDGNDPSLLKLTYQDSGAEYNILEHEEEQDPETRIGGRGTALIKGLAQSVQFQRLNGWNYLYLEFETN